MTKFQVLGIASLLFILITYLRKFRRPALDKLLSAFSWPPEYFLYWIRRLRINWLISSELAVAQISFFTSPFWDLDILPCFYTQK